MDCVELYEGETQVGKSKEAKKRGALMVTIKPDFFQFFDTSVMFSLKLVPQAQTSQELRMLSNVTISCQVKKIVMNTGSK